MTETPVLLGLDARVEAFEAAWAAGPPELGRFLPPPADPAYFDVLTELVRIDLEFRHARGPAADLDHYRAAFPGLFADPARAGQLAFEDYRLRAAAGEDPRPADYARRYGVDVSGWPPPPADTAVVAVGPGVPAAFPEPGDTVMDLRLTADLGRGSFGRVYLAEQTKLAGRRVAVKLSTRFGAAEPETMARLQHTHIVPVYSTATAGPFQVVVMPFLGATTLADVLAALRGRAAWPASGKALADTLATRRGKTLPAAAGPAPVPAPAPVAAATLARLTLPEAVLWLGAKLADALAHAHARGVLHRDVKPANVLLTDDGLPMLLDFNLADDDGRDGPREAGGTPAYMAPEQLAAFRGGRPADARADVFALGVVLFELLTGCHPYPHMGQETAAGSPWVRRLNPAVSPAAEAIVRRCVHPDAAERYPSAAALAEDLERQLAHRPLLHTREPSSRERAAKWRRRNPKLAVTAAAAAVVATVGGLAEGQYREAGRVARERDIAAATVAFAEFAPAAADATEDLALHADEPRRRAAGADKVAAILARYNPPDAADWAARPPASLLGPDRRLALRAELADLLLLQAAADPDPAAALALTDRAAAAYALAGEPAPRAVAWFQAARGRPVAAETGENAESASARDFYLEGLARLRAGEHRAAAESLATAVRFDPTHYWAWLALGTANRDLGRDADAEGCFNACVALRPNLPAGFFSRGQARFRRAAFAAADADFTAVLDLRPNRTDALADRGLTRLRLGRPAAAAADLTAALAAGATETRLYFLRADAKAAAGDAAGAAADRALGLAKDPTDEASRVVRGLYRARLKDTAGAVADFDAALALNPRSFPALQNKAFALSEANRDADAIAVLNEAVRLFPDSLDARAGRAVLLARRGDRAAAHADAARCRALAPPADTLYQLAGAYAQTAKTHPEDARTAFRLLADALRSGAGFDDVDADPDLAPLREMPEFKAVVEAARAVRPPQPTPGSIR